MAKPKILLKAEFLVNEDGFIDLGFGDLITKKVFIESLKEYSSEGMMFAHDHPSLRMDENLIEFMQETQEEVKLVFVVGDEEISLIGTISKLDQSLPGVVSQDHKSIVFTTVPSSSG